MENKKTRRVKPMDEYIGDITIKCVRRYNRDMYYLSDVMMLLNISIRDVLKVVSRNELYRYKNSGYDELFIHDNNLRKLILTYGGEEFNNYRDKVAYVDQCIHWSGFYVEPLMEWSYGVDIGELNLYKTEEYVDFTDFDICSKGNVDNDEFTTDVTDDDLDAINKYAYGK